MGQLKQKYAWSESRVRTLRSCMWRYYLTYYQAWEGWVSSAPQEKRQAYTIKNMTNLPMFIGSVVHDTIEELIKSTRETNAWPELETVQASAIDKLRRGWLDSTKKRWQKSPKYYVNLAEHYYQQEIDERRLQEYKNKTLQCLKAFYDCPFFEIIKSLKKEDWLSLEDFQSFQMNTGEEVSVKIDCGFRHKGKAFLLDWKTGKVNDSVIDQLVTYSMYAIKQGWAKTPDDVVIVPVYLAAYAKLGDDAMPKLTVSAKHIHRQAEIIRQESPMLQQAHDNKDNPEFFEHTDDPRECERCHFRGICKGAQTEITDDATPF